MEKFRAFLEVLKKYHFWVLCGLILLLSFGSWFLATSNEEKNFDTRKRAIEGKLSLVHTISGNPAHPSKPYIDEILSITSGSLASKVENTSNRLYTEQRESNPLPRLFPDDNDQTLFKAAFEKIWRPMEEIEKLPPGTLDEFYRSRYRDHIADHFPKLFGLIERRTEVESTDGVVAGGGHKPGPRIPMGLGNKDPGDETRKTVGIVDWDDADQKIKAFLDRFSGGTPTTLDIMTAQEDLWVYETLLKVIRNTNNFSADPKEYKKPPSHKEARIKQILAMDIGKDAVVSWTRCEKALFNLPAEAAAAVGNEKGGSPAQMPSLRGMTGSSQNSGSSPLVGRYVDDKGRPLSDTSQQPYGEFRMMPINLKVVIEQRDIPRLLAECANSAMRIDVRGVRILVETPPAVDLTSTEASAGGVPPAGKETGPMPTKAVGHEVMSHLAMSHGGMGHGGMGTHSGGGTGDFVYDEESADPVYQPVPVEVQGIIYIYNPPRIQNPGATAGENGGQAAAPPASGPTTAPPTSPAATGPATTPAAIRPIPAGAASTAPTATGGPAKPATVTPDKGGRRP